MDAGGKPNAGQNEGHPSLFRPEALAAAVENGFGQPIARLPVSWTVLTIVMGLMLTAFTVLMLVGTYNRKETAVGLVSSAGGDVRVTASSTGIVKDVLVSDGQHVRAGQALVTVNTLHNGVNGHSVDQELLDNLDQEISNLKGRLRSLTEAADIDLSGMPARLGALEGERRSVAEQGQAINKRLALAQESLLKLGPVAERGFISGETMRRRKDEVLVLQQSLADTRGTEVRLLGQISDLRNLVARHPLTVEQQRGELLDHLARTQRDRQSAAEQRGFSVTSPIFGVVTTVQVVEGQPVDPQLTLMNVSTRPKRMLAEIFIPSRAIGFLEYGQEVRLRYDAFPYQRFGGGTGRVTSISSTVLRPDQVAATIRVDEPVYRVLVTLDQNNIVAYGHRYDIRAGFALTADIILERRTFAEWLLDPIVALRGHL